MFGVIYPPHNVLVPITLFGNPAQTDTNFLDTGNGGFLDVGNGGFLETQ